MLPRIMQVLADYDPPDRSKAQIYVNCDNFHVSGEGGAAGWVVLRHQQKSLF